MFFRYFLALCVIAFAFTATKVHAEEDTQIEDRANPAVKIVLKLFASVFASAAASCVAEAASKCKDHWRQPQEALKCGKGFFAANKGRCAVGK